MPGVPAMGCRCWPDGRVAVNVLLAPVSRPATSVRISAANRLCVETVSGSRRPAVCNCEFACHRSSCGRVYHHKLLQ